MLWIHIYPEKKKKIKKYTFQNYPPCQKKIAFPYIQSYVYVYVNDAISIIENNLQSIKYHGILHRYNS